MIVEIFLLLAALVLLVPIATLFVECLAAWGDAPRRPVPAERTPRVALLVPAHNEASGLGVMLQVLLPELTPDKRVVVIADNCTDATAEIARKAAVTVLERREPTQFGKSFALAYGIDFLAGDPPDVVIILDADCRAAPGALDRIARLAYASGRPVQSVYLLDAPPHAHPTQLLSSFAFRVKNLVRPVGSARLGLPGFLTGSGMAFPWQVIRTVPLASGTLVEDMWLTIELARKQQLVILDAGTRIFGQMPASPQGARAQRTRWEHGHLETIFYGAPRLIAAAWQQKRFAPLWLMLDVCVPPLSLLVVAWAGVFLLGLVVRAFGFSSTALVWSIGEGALLFCAVGAAWWKYGRDELQPALLFSVPLYVLSKIPIYGAFFVRRQTRWERSERDPVTPPVE